MKHQKRNIHLTTNISIYTCYRHFEVLFCTYCKGFFVFQTSHYAYIPPYMLKTLPTLENEKEQEH